MSNPQVAHSPRLPGQIPIQSTRKYASTSEDDASHGYNPRTGRGRGGRGRGGGQPTYQREAMENRRRGGNAEYGGSGARVPPAVHEEVGRPSPRTRRPRDQDSPRPGSGAKAHDETFEDAPWIKAQKEAARKKAEQARWVNSGSNGTRIYNLYAEPPMDWDDCEGAKKFRSIAKWVLNTEDLPPISHEALEGYKGTSWVDHLVRLFISHRVVHSLQPFSNHYSTITSYDQGC